MNVCLECKKEFKSERALHCHVKAHDISIAEYYCRHYPRYDLFTGELIEFRDNQQYFTTFFKSRSNMKSWLLKADKQEVVRFISDGLNIYYKDQMERYNNPLAPNQIDSRVVKYLVPLSFQSRKLDLTPSQLIEIFPNFKFNFKYDKRIHIRRPSLIAVDTREQKPIKLSISPRVQKLDFGDYVAYGKDYTGVFIERKSLSDFVSTLSLGYDRFKRELQRLQEADCYMVVVVEEAFIDAMNFRSYLNVDEKVKATSAFIFHRVRELMREYNQNLQFLFVDGRIECSRVFPKILGMSKEDVVEADLQYYYDMERL